ncbi:TOTE conflict system archaeo-eukaryotic primase domain-containing protein [Nocardia sp. NPDC002869]|uniref:TOTE conflict system archaeo-eukaryotic primase domain-containing protein n=1 Tax=Nocardia sp. NPDC002869 TaxID=3161032 RepID=UPI00398C9E57
MAVEAFPGEVEALRAENARLRNLLRFTGDQACAAEPDQTAADTPVDMRAAPAAKVAFFLDLFGARTDTYAVRWENRHDGRSGWVPAIRGKWRKGMAPDQVSYLPLTADVVDRHLRGGHHIGLYPLADDDTCWWVAADFDKDTAMLDASAYVKAARAAGIPAALEISQSGRGAHVWIFFATAVPAVAARRIATGLLAEAIGLRGRMSLSSYDRLFPSQDTHPGRGVGNLIAAPLAGARRQHGTTVFLDPATLEPFEDQWAYLSSIARLSTKQVEGFASSLPQPQLGHDVRRLRLPTASKIVPRPAAVVRAAFGARIQLTATDLGPAMISAVKHAASIANPEFFARQRARRSTWDTPRFLRSYDETLDGDLILPRGLLPLLTRLIESADSTLHLTDTRSTGTPQDFTCTAELRTEQQHAVPAATTGDTAVMVAPPGTGKTVIACAVIAARATSTLVIVDRKALADQWRARITDHLGVKCGQIGGGRSKTTGVLDVALLPTLARRSNIDELTSGYGFVVVDECHHVASSAFTDVLNKIPAKHWLGLTATPYRRDQLDDLIYHQLGAHTYTIDAPRAGHLPTDDAAPAPHPVLHVHSTGFAYAGDADPSQPGGMAEIYRALVADEDRLTQIVTDVAAAHRAGANILVLTTWINHLNALTDRLTTEGITGIITLRGGMNAGQRRTAHDAITTRLNNRVPLLIVGTGSYIGEGFDCPALDTLFLAAPVKFKGRLIQYVGRITRAHPGKTTATVHDYHDTHTSVLARTLQQRAPGYTELGFPDPRRQTTQ